LDRRGLCLVLDWGPLNLLCGRLLHLLAGRLLGLLCGRLLRLLAGRLLGLLCGRLLHLLAGRLLGLLCGRLLNLVPLHRLLDRLLGPCPGLGLLSHTLLCLRRR